MVEANEGINMEKENWLEMGVRMSNLVKVVRVNEIEGLMMLIRNHLHIKMELLIPTNKALDMLMNHLKIDGKTLSEERCESESDSK